MDAPAGQTALADTALYHRIVDHRARYNRNADWTTPVTPRPLSNLFRQRPYMRRQKFTTLNFCPESYTFTSMKIFTTVKNGDQYSDQTGDYKSVVLSKNQS
jgi:hypothetical protein